MLYSRAWNKDPPHIMTALPAAAALAATLALAGCGLKAPLYLPAATVPPGGAQAAAGGGTRGAADAPACPPAGAPEAPAAGCR